MKPLPRIAAARSLLPRTDPGCLPAARGRSRSAQRGVALIITLLALVIMMLGAVALVRSFSASQEMAGNLAFKRDLINQAERASIDVLARFDATGALGTVAARSHHLVAQNYRASLYTPMLASETGCPNNRVNAQGIPCVLLSDTAFATAGTAANDIAVAAQGVTLRWVIDRLCSDEGSEVTLGSEKCSTGPTPDARGGSASNLNPATLLPQVLYRLSVRVTGPRNTQAYFQTTIAI